ncbi:hypothetical protein DFP72DRAFT_1063971 [Ephemerocybe angulata]|uniref:Uncharacterized protein n=1 Tax=Ephemerocybe angulata TaxID=980116 RepID=A0A8H6I8T5_9AGAR|nr:hypothetical protein DFP72DRAFT_1063971 [Tulosesus angulatus]
MLQSLSTPGVPDPLQVQFGLNDILTRRDRSDDSARRELATSYASVSAALHEVVTSVLWRHVTIRTAQAVGPVVRMAKYGSALWDNSQGLGVLCRRLDVSMTVPWSVAEIRPLLRVLPHLEVLVVDNGTLAGDGASLGRALVKEIASTGITSIRRLEFWGQSLETVTNDLVVLARQLPRLETLHLTGIINPREVDEGPVDLTTTTFLSLTTLSVTGAYRPPGDRFDEGLQSIADAHDLLPALVHFDVDYGLRRRHPPLTEFIQNRGHRLLRLSLDTRDWATLEGLDLPHALRDLRMLRIRSDHNGWMMRDDYARWIIPTALPNVETIVLLEGPGMHTTWSLGGLEGYLSEVLREHRYVSLRRLELHLRRASVMRRGFRQRMEGVVEQLRSYGYDADMYFELD